MRNSNTHFAPTPVKLDKTPGRSPTLVCVSTLLGVPDWVRDTFGQRVLNDANRAAMLDFERIDDHDCFIPHRTMSTFLETVARKSGSGNLGILLAPELDFGSYGVWSDYVLGSGTLGQAIRRAEQSIAYHSYGDRMALIVADDTARLTYRSATRTMAGYPHDAAGTIAVLLSLFSHFLNQTWHPRRIEIDLPAPDDAQDYEDVFQSPVLFDKPELALVFDASDLTASRQQKPGRPPTTIEDVARARLAPETRNSLIGAVSHYIRCQVGSGRSSIEHAAQALDVSVRSLQRELNTAGRSFRDMMREARTRRAMELLRDERLSVTTISDALGYSSSAHFARAFRRDIGLSPMAFRKTARAGE